MKEEDLSSSDFPDDDGDNFDNDPTFALNSTTSQHIQPKKKRQVKPKVCAEWTNDDIFKLISCVKSVKMLWNAKDEKYRNKIERKSAWKQISDADFDRKFSDTELMAKWTNMRIQYRSYFAKYRKTKSGQGKDESIKWKFYEAMDFVDSAEGEQTATTASNLMNADERPIDSPFAQSSKSTPETSKRRRLSQLSSVTSTSSPAAIVAKGMKEALNQLREPQQDHEDEFDAFGKYIAIELRALSDPIIARRVRLKIVRTLIDSIEDAV